MTEPSLEERAAATVQLLTAAAGLIGLLWVGLAKVVKPYQEWRRKHLASVVGEILGPVLERLRIAVQREEDCTQLQQRVLERQSVIFADMDAFLKLALDNAERHDETSELLDRVFGLERRVDFDQRKEIDNLLHTLRERQKQRRQEGTP